MIGRQVGVTVPQGQFEDADKTEPWQVLGVADVELKFVRYSDGYGSVIQEFWYKVGDALYQPPEASRFAQQVRPVKERLAQQVLARIRSRHAALLPKDEVDFAADEAAEEVRTLADLDVPEEAGT